MDRIHQHVPKFITTGQIPNFHNISTRSAKSSTPVMFSESATGQHLLDNPMWAKYFSDGKFTVLLFGRSSFHSSVLEGVIQQIVQAKFMPPKRVCLQLENLVLITLFWV